MNSLQKFCSVIEINSLINDLSKLNSENYDDFTAMSD